MTSLEPWRQPARDPALAETLKELSAREPVFHRPEYGTARGDFDKMMADGFWEVGASGRRYSRQYVLEALEKRHASAHEDIWETSDFWCRQLSADTYLVTYTLLQDKVRLTRRSSIWQNTAAGWKIVYHQGTIVEDPAPNLATSK